MFSFGRPLGDVGGGPRDILRCFSLQLKNLVGAGICFIFGGPTVAVGSGVVHCWQTWLCDVADGMCFLASHFRQRAMLFLA